MSSGLLGGWFNLESNLIAPSGTRCMFHQSTMPAGWVSDPNAYADYAVRTVTGTGGGSGGSTGFSSFNNGGTFNFNSFTLSVAQMATHSHSMTSNHTHQVSNGDNCMEIGGSTWVNAVSNSAVNGYLSSTTTASTTGVSLQNNGSGSSITHSITTPNVKYADFGIGVKS